MAQVLSGLKKTLLGRLFTNKADRFISASDTP